MRAFRPIALVKIVVAPIAVQVFKRVVDFINKRSFVVAEIVCLHAL
jgi:maleate cis-trans isomerase